MMSEHEVRTLGEMERLLTLTEPRLARMMTHRGQHLTVPGFATIPGFRFAALLALGGLTLIVVGACTPTHELLVLGLFVMFAFPLPLSLSASRSANVNRSIPPGTPWWQT